jgi:hypothetical protein
MYSVHTRLGNGELLFVASREKLGEALHLVQGLNANWPQEYVIRDSKGNDIDPKHYSPFFPTRVEPDAPPRSFRQARWRGEFLEKLLN